MRINHAGPKMKPNTNTPKCVQPFANCSVRLAFASHTHPHCATSIDADVEYVPACAIYDNRYTLPTLSEHRSETIYSDARENI